jgi:hypothetical protein
LRAKGAGWKRIAAEMEVVRSKLSIASPGRVPKLGKRLFEPSLKLALAFVDLPPGRNLR